MVISICNQKGGVGKTTTAINLSAGLAEKRKRVLLIDLDPQSNATTGAGLEPAAERSVFHVLTGSVPIMDAVRQTDLAGLWVLPSHIHLARRINELEARSYREELLRTALAPAIDRFNYVVIDPPPALNVLSQNAIAASDWLVIPCKMDKYSLDGLGDLFDTIQDVTRGRSPLPYKLLLTQYESRNTRTNAAIEQELEEYRTKGLIYSTRIRKNEALNQAHLVGQSVFKYDAKSVGADDYRALVLEVIKHG